MSKHASRRLIFLTLPPTIKSGSDCVSQRGADVCQSLGVHTKFLEIWPEKYAKLLLKRKSRIGHLLFKYLISPIFSSKVSKMIQPDDIVWMYDISRYNSLSSCEFEKGIKIRGAKYVFHLHDDWFSVRGWDQAAVDRVSLADLAGGLTKGLVSRIEQYSCGANPILLRGPIDVERLAPLQNTVPGSRPKVVWTGNPANLKEIPGAMDVLARVYARQPFNFLVISGSVRPNLDLAIPWQWLPYDGAKESERLTGACAGLAPLENTPYAKCKDVYKVKTYMACGVPPIATAIGNNLEVIRHGKTGYLANSTDEWESKLFELVSNPSMADAMGKVARVDCVSRFSHEAIIPEWITALEANFGQLRN